MPESCFADRLGGLIALTPGEYAALAQLEQRERRLRRGGVLVRENDRLAEMFVLKQGMMMSYVLLDDGSRQILRFLYPGDLLGLSTIAYGNSLETVMALSESVVCPFDRTELVTLFDDYPRIGMAILAFDQMERVLMTDRLAAIGRTSAKARVAALLIELRNRLNAGAGAFSPGVTQEEMGDATGLTAVHVNRMLRQLEEEKLIAREPGRMTILEEKRLAYAANYVDRVAGLDLKWLSTPR